MSAAQTWLTKVSTNSSVSFIHCPEHEHKPMSLLEEWYCCFRDQGGPFIPPHYIVKLSEFVIRILKKQLNGKTRISLLNFHLSQPVNTVGCLRYADLEGTV